MCTNPLKGFINRNGYVVKVSRKADYVRMVEGDYKSYFGEPTPDALTKFIDLPCRQCNECIMTMKREWTARAIAESMLHDDMIFITLTYDDINLKMAETITEHGEIYLHPTLDHEHFQKFMRRLRDYYHDKNIRFFMCGEYGSRTYRPHYHAIIYGIGLKDIKDLKVYNKNTNGDLLYTSEIMQYNIWQKGFTIIGNCDIASCCYVAGYVDKKFGKTKGKEFYNLTKIVPPYVKSSNKPGLGREWFNNNIDRYKSIYDYISLPLGLQDPQRVYLTENWKKLIERHWLDNVDLEKIILYDDLKVKKRQMFQDRKLEICMEGTDKNKEEYLETIDANLKRKKERKVRDYE